MFDLFVYLFAVVFILLLVAPRPTQSIEVACNEPLQVAPRPTRKPEEAGLRPADGVDQLVSELLAVAPSPTPIAWGELSDRQVRSLCELHGIKTNKRGRVAQIHRERLMAVA